MRENYKGRRQQRPNYSPTNNFFSTSTKEELSELPFIRNRKNSRRIGSSESNKGTDVNVSYGEIKTILGGIKNKELRIKGVGKRLTNCKKLFSLTMSPPPGEMSSLNNFDTPRPTSQESIIHLPNERKNSNNNSNILPPQPYKNYFDCILNVSQSKTKSPIKQLQYYFYKYINSSMDNSYYLNFQQFLLIKFDLGFPELYIDILFFLFGYKLPALYINNNYYARLKCQTEGIHYYKTLNKQDSFQSILEKYM